MVKTIKLFTLTACPTGRNIGTVLREVVERHPEIELETRYVEIHVEETNSHRIKNNPTVLFLDEQDRELARMEGFHETDAVEAMIRDIESGVVKVGERSENAPVTETYTVYLFDGSEPVSLEVAHQNLTGVKAPRITAIQVLLSSKMEGLLNPFPDDTKLERVQFHDRKGRVHLNILHEPDVQTRKQMETVLQKTLSHYGIEDVEAVLQPAAGGNA